jgi:hypothetical protein
MDEKIIATYCLCDDLVHAMHHQKNPQCQMNDAEVLTTAFTAAVFFRGNLESARWMLKQHHYILRINTLHRQTLANQICKVSRRHEDVHRLLFSLSPLWRWLCA